MKVSRRGLYALQALIHLAEVYEGGLVAARTIAEKEGIPEKFLEGILLALKNARVISSERGREGGYRLRKPPQELFIGDVVRLIDGPLAPFGDVVELQHRSSRRRRATRGSSTLFLEVRNAASVMWTARAWRISWSATAGSWPLGAGARDRDVRSLGVLKCIVNP